MSSPSGPRTSHLALAMTPKHLALLLLPLVLPVSSAPVREELALRPAKGVVRGYSFAQDVELDLQDVTGSMSQGGNEMEMPPFDGSVTIEQRERIAFKDEVVELEDGRVTKLRRTYDDLTREQSTSADGEETDVDGRSLLEGEVVVFTWDADDEEYDVTFEEDGDEDLLEDLRIEVDLRAFLPGRAVAEGDQWTVPAKAMVALMSPGGDVHILMGEREEEDEDEKELGRQIEENLEGEVTCRLTGLREEDGARLAVIAVTAKVSSEGSVDGEFDTDQASGEYTQGRELVVDVEGELVWNVTAGHAVSIELEGDLTFVLVQDVELPAMDARQHVRQEFEGSILFKAAVE